MGDIFDDKIREALERGTENSINLKEKVWEGIRMEVEPRYRE
jgi:hypothetical protein